MEKKELTGYPSVDKPWLKYYNRKTIERRLTPNTIYGHLWEKNKDYQNDTALIYFEKKITYKELFEKIEQCARCLAALGVKAGDIITIQSLAIPQTVVLVYALSKIGAVANLIYVSNTEAEVNHILKYTDSRLYIVLDGIYEKSISVLDETKVEKVVLLSIDTEMDILTRVIYRLSSRKRNPRYSENVLSWDSFMAFGGGVAQYADARLMTNGQLLWYIQVAQQVPLKPLCSQIAA